MGVVWGFGTSAVDLRIVTADYGEGYKDKLLAQKIFRMGGGSTSNFLVQVSKLGFRSGLLSKLGRDGVGLEIVRMLKAENVDCSGIILDDNAVSPFNVAVYAGENKRRVGGFLLPNCLAEITEDELAVLAQKVQPGDYVLVEIGEIPIPTCLAFCGLLRERQAKIVMDVDLDPVRQCGSDPGTVRALLDCADYLMPNITSLASLYPSGTVEEITEDLAKRHHCVAVTTLGAKGAAYSVSGEKAVIVPTIKITPVDTVGAGDAFHGGFIAGLSAGKGLEDAILLGNVCGAHVCLAFGIRDVMLTAAELEKYNVRI